VLEDLRGETAFGGRGGGGSAQEDDFKHKQYCTSIKKQESFPWERDTLAGLTTNNLAQLDRIVPMPSGRPPIILGIVRFP
jgi:hypothetical protein